MKRAPLFVIAGTVAGLAGVLSFHSRPAATAALPGTHAGTTGPGRTTARHAGRRVAAGRLRSRSVLGAMEQYGYGELAVRVTARGGRIVNVAVAEIKTAEPYSANLAHQAIPMLRSEVLSAQTASINGVSGATYTSAAYARSLQAALDKLHLR